MKKLMRCDLCGRAYEEKDLCKVEKRKNFISEIFKERRNPEYEILCGGCLK